MTSTTASSADIPPDNDLPLSAHLTEPAEPTTSTVKPSAVRPDEPDTPAQSAAYRLGGKGSRLWRPVSDNRSLLQKVVSALVFCVLLGAVFFLWLTVRQQQIQLTTLDAAFRSGQLQTLPDRMQNIEDRLQQYVLKSQADKWQQGLSEQSQSLTAFGQQLSSMATDVKAAQAAAAQAIAGQDETVTKIDTLQQALDAQTLRIDTLESWKTEWSQRTSPPSTKTASASGGSQPTVKKPSKPRVLKPPFTLVSIERRGGQAYAVVLPAGAGGWAQLRMLSPGEALSDWTLVSINGQHAEFQVNGQIQRVTL
ncbi:hypothetical protein [Salmonella enterica]|uniref:Plasmid transfer protein n=2 Tax=Salmonella enterica TaxID=28901 RepID=A0A6C7C9Q7_SALER|nr:hypothetical protein [Salmonella enterica]ECC1658126.1 hypothetical protein [Salmonella enterica subsp. salamae]ASG86823.1 hypothetical protein LFZ47_04095 [Salmonella enterica subsp. salamae serovar 55:k:z39 str. 1315K]ECD9415869.1 hypothetical protein [Salmonella enterica subsp. salamae]ECF5932728.1 hypothetical protein [Salmonella enterica subsp. salamae]ECG1251640.1 hypothetical protein [Salmonella enterica subsp. salamae]